MAKKTGIDKAASAAGVGKRVPVAPPAVDVPLPGFDPPGNGGGPGDGWGGDGGGDDGEARRGRPPGSRNRRTEDLVRYLAGVGCEEPGLYLARAYSMPLEDYLEQRKLTLSADNIRWAEEQRRQAAVALLPYVHQRQPQALELTDRQALDVRITVENDDGDIIELHGDALEGHLLDVAKRARISRS